MSSLWPISSHCFPVISTNAIFYFSVEIALEYLWCEALAFLFHADPQSSLSIIVALVICCLACVRDGLTISVVTVSVLFLYSAAWPFMVHSHLRHDWTIWCWGSVKDISDGIVQVALHDYGRESMPHICKVGLSGQMLGILLGVSSNSSLHFYPLLKSPEWYVGFSYTAGYFLVKFFF